VAADPPSLIGNWKLVTYQIVVGNELPRPALGDHPKGHLILTPQGRMSALLTAGNRRFGSSEAERAELWKSMLAYSGKYRTEGDNFITEVDISWNEAWNGTEQRRHYKVSGDRLSIVTTPQPSSVYGGKTYYAELIWEREK
jgi:Lipocalin-like domain